MDTINLDGAGDKPRLTAEQKRQNHIESEKKRREAIRAGFERLSQIVPGCEGQSRSEQVVLGSSIKFMKQLLAKRDAMREQALAIGYSDGDFEKMYRDAEKALQEASAEPEEEEEDEGEEEPVASSSRGRRR